MVLRLEFVKQHIDMLKQTINIWKIIKEDASNLYGWAVSQELPVNGFKWVKNLSKFNEGFIKNMMKIVIEDIFLK